jgi:hypothetical protein
VKIFAEGRLASVLSRVTRFGKFAIIRRLITWEGILKKNDTWPEF